MRRTPKRPRRARERPRVDPVAPVDQGLFQAAFHNSPAMQSVVRVTDGVLVEVNDTFLNKLGFRREQVLGKTPFELQFWVEPEKLLSYRQELETKGFVQGREVRLRTRSGDILTVLLSTHPVAIGGVPHFLSAGVDITARKRAEEKLRESELQLRDSEAKLQNALAKERELGQLKSDFVSLVSHEFRTPLEIIMSSVDNLDRYHDRLSAEKRQQLLRTINKSVRRMSGMMEEVLVLGRLETDRMTFTPVAFDWPAFCQRMCDEIEAATGKRCPVQRQGPSASKQAFGDESVLRHIFTNLLSNAVKYSPAGQTVDFIVQREGRDAVCHVVDRGCGIPAADQKRLFQAFHRGSNVRQIPGTGLGLLIVKRCVELHEGEIQFESSEVDGTTFTVRIPLFGSP